MLLRGLLPLLAVSRQVRGDPFTLTVGDPATYTKPPGSSSTLTGRSFAVDLPPGSDEATIDKGVDVMLSRELKNDLMAAVKGHCKNPFDESCTKAIAEVTRTTEADRLGRRFLVTAGAVAAGLEVAAIAGVLGVGLLVFFVLVPLLEEKFWEGNDEIQVPHQNFENFKDAVGKPTIVVVGPGSSVLGTITTTAMAAATTMPAPSAQIITVAEPDFDVGDLKITLPLDLARKFDTYTGQLGDCPQFSAKVKRADVQECVEEHLEAAGVQLATIFEPFLNWQGEVPAVRELVPVFDRIPDFANGLAPALGVAAANVRNPLRGIAVVQRQRMRVGPLLIAVPRAIIVTGVSVIIRVASDQFVQNSQSLTMTTSSAPSSCVRQTYVPNTQDLTIPPLNLPTGFPGPVIPTGTKPKGPFEQDKVLCGAFGNQLRLERGTAIDLADKFCDASAGINAKLDPKALPNSGSNKRREQDFPNPDKRHKGDATLVTVVAGFADQPGCENAPVFDMHKNVAECKEILHNIIDFCDTDSLGLRNWKAGGGWYRDCILWEFFADVPLESDEP